LNIHTLDLLGELKAPGLAVKLAELLENITVRVDQCPEVVRQRLDGAHDALVQQANTVGAHSLDKGNEFRKVIVLFALEGRVVARDNGAAIGRDDHGVRRETLDKRVTVPRGVRERERSSLRATRGTGRSRRLLAAGGGRRVGGSSMLCSLERPGGKRVGNTVRNTNTNTNTKTAPKRVNVVNQDFLDHDLELDVDVKLDRLHGAQVRLNVQ